MSYVLVLMISFIVINLVSTIKVNAADQYLAVCNYHDRNDYSKMLMIIVHSNKVIDYQHGKYEAPASAGVPIFVKYTETYNFDSSITYSDFLNSKQQTICPRKVKFTVNGTDVNVSITANNDEANFDSYMSKDTLLNNSSYNNNNSGVGSSFFDCSNERFVSIIRLLKAFLQVIQIGVPIGLIILGSIDLGKAVVSLDEDGMKKGQKTFMRRCIAAVLVFLVTTIVNLIMGTLAGSNADWQKCWNPDTAFIESTTKNYFS